MYNRLTPAEQIYIKQDGSTAADINAADAWTIIDYLTPLYGRYTAAQEYILDIEKGPWE